MTEFVVVAEQVPVTDVHTAGATTVHVAATTPFEQLSAHVPDAPVHANDEPRRVTAGVALIEFAALQVPV